MQLSIMPVLVGASLLAISQASAASCSSDIGAIEARQLVKQCIEVSTSTHPPCNVQNSCDIMVDEIQRGCNLARSSSSKLPRFCSPPTPTVQSRTIGPEFTGRWGGMIEQFKRDCKADPDSDDGPLVITSEAVHMFPDMCSIRGTEVKGDHTVVIALCGSEDGESKPKLTRKNYKLEGDRLTISWGKGPDQVRWELKQCPR